MPKKRQMIQPIYRLIYLIYSWPAIIVTWLIAYLCMIILSIGSNRKEIIYNILSRFFARVSMRLLGVRVRIEGIDNIPDNEPVIFVSNHQSFFDITIAFAYIPNNFSFISKESVFHVPLIGQLMKASGHISLKRESGKKAYETMVETVNKLNMGKSLVVFPEGTRSADGRLGTFKRGISLVISQSGRKALPMAIIGSGRFLPKDSVICSPQYRDITLRFGKPLTFEKRAKASHEEVNKMVENIRDSISELICNEM